MAQWQRKLDIAEVWTTKDVHLIAAAISSGLKGMAPVPSEHVECQREELIEMFSDMAEDKDADADDLDSVLSDLYDWADTPLDDKWNGKKVCWIKTF